MFLPSLIHLGSMHGMGNVPVDHFLDSELEISRASTSKTIPGFGASDKREI